MQRLFGGLFHRQGDEAAREPPALEGRPPPRLSLNFRRRSDRRRSLALQPGSKVEANGDAYEPSEVHAANGAGTSRLHVIPDDRPTDLEMPKPTQASQAPVSSHSPTAADSPSAPFDWERQGFARQHVDPELLSTDASGRASTAGSRRFVSLSPDREQFFRLRPSQDRRPSLGTRPLWDSPGRKSSPSGPGPSRDHGRPSLGDWAGRRSPEQGRPSLQHWAPDRRSPEQGRPSLGERPTASDRSPERVSREHSRADEPPTSRRASLSPPSERRRSSAVGARRVSISPPDNRRNSLGERRSSISPTDSRSSRSERRVAFMDSSDVPQRLFTREQASPQDSRPSGASPGQGRRVSISPEVRRVSISPDGQRSQVSMERISIGDRSRVSIGDRISPDPRRSSLGTRSNASSTPEDRRSSISQRSHTSRRSVDFSRALHQSGGRIAPELPDFVKDPNAVLSDDAAWRDERPTYAAATERFNEERSVFFPPGSTEDIVTSLIKNWEKEVSHKLDPGEWRTVDVDTYRFSCNSGRKITADELARIGTYNAFIGEHPLYSASKTSFEESHKLFKAAMPGGFCWEIVELYSGPPLATFKWRHWGRMTGPLKCPMGHGSYMHLPATDQDIEMFGIGIARLDASFRITSLEVFHDPHELLSSMAGSHMQLPGGQPQSQLDPCTDHDGKDQPGHTAPSKAQRQPSVVWSSVDGHSRSSMDSDYFPPSEVDF